MALGLPHVVRVTRTLPGPLNPLGQPTPGGERVVHDQLPCRIRERSESEVVGDGQYFSQATYSLRVPLDADVARGDRIQVGGIAGVIRYVLDRAGYQHAILESTIRTGGPITPVVADSRLLWGADTLITWGGDTEIIWRGI